jgi:hypothetical protein
MAKRLLEQSVPRRDDTDEVERADMVGFVMQDRCAEPRGLGESAFPLRDMGEA